MNAFIPLIQFSITLIFLLYASITDLKERIVKNKATFSLLVVGFLFHLSLSFYYNNYLFIINSVISAVLAFLFSFALYKLGVWAGGDVKLLTGIAALNPFNPKALHFIAFIPLKEISIPIFFLQLFIATVLTVFPYAAFLSFYLLTKNEKMKKETIDSFKQLFYLMVLFSFFVTSLKELLSFFQPLILTMTLLLLSFFYAFIPRKLKACSILLFAFTFFVREANNILSSFAVIFSSIIVFTSLLFFYKQSKKLLIEEKSIKELKEGDIIAVNIIENNGKILIEEPLTLTKTIKYLKELNLNELKSKGRVIASYVNARGLNETELKELKRLQEKGLIEMIKVKKSMAMVPLILIAYVILNITGDFLWLLI